MEKYKVFEKLKKTRLCSYYLAENLITKEVVTIKKLTQTANWDELLKRREVAMMKQAHFPFLARIKEIVKEGGKFFVVHEQLTQCLDDLKKKELTLSEVANMGRQMIEIVLQLAKQGVKLLELRPDFFFVNKKRVKLVHILSLGDQDTNGLDLQQDYKYFAPEVNLSNKIENPDISIVFTLGCIICELLIGKPLIPAKSKIDYMYIVCGLWPKQNIGSMRDSNQITTETLQSFQSLLEGVCDSSDFITLLGDMTKVDQKQRIKLQEAHKRMKHLQQELQKQERDKVHKKPSSTILNSSEIIDRMTKKVEEVAQHRMRQSPEVTKPVNKIIRSNHQISLNLDHDLYERIGFMPNIPRECQPLRTEKNVQDNAMLSSVHKHQRHPSDFFIPETEKKQFPKLEHRRLSLHKKQPKSTDATQFRLKKQKMKTEVEVEEGEPRPVFNRNINLALTQKIMPSRQPQLTNYALNMNKNLGVGMAAEADFNSQEDLAAL